MRARAATRSQARCAERGPMRRSTFSPEPPASVNVASSCQSIVSTAFSRLPRDSLQNHRVIAVGGVVDAAPPAVVRSRARPVGAAISKADRVPARPASPLSLRATSREHVAPAAALSGARTCTQVGLADTYALMSACVPRRRPRFGCRDARPHSSRQNAFDPIVGRRGGLSACRDEPAGRRDDPPGYRGWWRVGPHEVGAAAAGM